MAIKLMLSILLILVFLIVLFVYPNITGLSIFAQKNTYVMLETSLGNIKIMLFDEKAPVTTKNFKELVSKGFYDGVKFHRVIEGFMVQGGDPTGTGSGGPGYNIKDEFTPELRHNKKGIVAMANTGRPNTGGSQFYVALAPTPWLDDRHTVFGEVVEGLDVLESIGKTKTDSLDRPIQPITINKAYIV